GGGGPGRRRGGPADLLQPDHPAVTARARYLRGVRVPDDLGPVPAAAAGGALAEHADADPGGHLAAGQPGTGRRGTAGGGRGTDGAEHPDLPRLATHVRTRPAQRITEGIVDDRLRYRAGGTHGRPAVLPGGPVRLRRPGRPR